MFQLRWLLFVGCCSVSDRTATLEVMEELSERGRFVKEEDVPEVDGFPYHHQAARPEERLINDYAVVQEAVRKMVTGVAFLAVSWSTVVLLGGFVTELPAMEFWFVAIMSLVLASR